MTHGFALQAHTLVRLYHLHERPYHLHEVLARPNLEKVNVLLDGVLLIVGHVILVKDGLLLALGLAGSTLDALIGIDIVRRPLGVILDEKDGIAWANIYARTTTLALTGNHISHFSFASM